MGNIRAKSPETAQKSRLNYKVNWKYKESWKKYCHGVVLGILWSQHIWNQLLEELLLIVSLLS